MLEPLLRLIAPHMCAICCREGDLLCVTCSACLPAVPCRCYACSAASGPERMCERCQTSKSLDGVYAATSYDENAKALLHALKFGRAGAAAEPMAKVMALQLRALDHLETYTVTYAPTAAARVRARGYDQAARLARVLARELNLPCRRLLVRNNASRQLGQTRAQRLQQMQTAFQPRPNASIANRRIILVDDVITTGATLESGARALKAAGAAEVIAAVFAMA